MQEIHNDYFNKKTYQRKLFKWKTYLFWGLSFHQLNFEFPNLEMFERGQKCKDFSQLSNFPQFIITIIIQEFSTAIAVSRINGKFFNMREQFLVFEQKMWLKEPRWSQMNLFNHAGFSFFFKIICNKKNSRSSSSERMYHLCFVFINFCQISPKKEPASMFSF